MATFKKIKNGIAPDLLKKARAVKDRKPHLKAMGRSVISLGKRAFTDPDLRAKAWAPRKDDLPHRLLQKSTMLRKSLRLQSVTNSVVTIGSDRPYAAAQQLGSSENNLPARPFLPFFRGRLTARGNLAVNRALAASLKAQGIG